jgi:hypothetical protein
MGKLRVLLLVLNVLSRLLYRCCPGHMYPRGHREMRVLYPRGRLRYFGSMTYLG